METLAPLSRAEGAFNIDGLFHGGRELFGSEADTLDTMHPWDFGGLFGDGAPLFVRPALESLPSALGASDYDLKRACPIRLASGRVQPRVSLLPFSSVRNGPPLRGGALSCRMLAAFHGNCLDTC